MIEVPPRGVLTFVSKKRGNSIAIFNPLTIVHFTRAPDDSEIDTLEAVAAAFLKRALPGGVLYVVARSDMGKGIDPRLRKVGEDLVRSGKGGANAAVVKVEGFGGAFVRGVFTGLALLGPSRDVLRVFGEVERACEWLAPKHGVTASDIRGAYSEVVRASGKTNPGAE